MSELGGLPLLARLAAGFARQVAPSFARLVRPGLQTEVLVGLDRLELSTSPLSGARSSHLSYRPIWWSWSGSNRRPPECKSGALPTELQPPDWCCFAFAGLGFFCFALLQRPGVALIRRPFRYAFGGRGSRFIGAQARLILNRGQLNAGSPRPAR